MKLKMKFDYSPGDTGEFISVDEGKCSGCGDCIDVCPVDAITITYPEVAKK